MANPSMNKRIKERQRQEKQREKAAKKAERKLEKGERPASDSGVDPDIAHIVPGPQPVSDDFT
jgi:hypothetical protein